MKDRDYTAPTFSEIRDDIVATLKDTEVMGDISDIGNIIGIAMGKYIKRRKIGYTIEDFISGVRHGISLVQGTH